MRLIFSIASTLVLLSVWAHMTLASRQAAAQDTGHEIAAGDIVFDGESGLLSVDIGAVPLADVLRSIVEQTDAKLIIRDDVGTTVAQRFRGIPLERGIRRLAAGEMRFGMVIEYEPSASDSGARVPAKIVVFAASGSPAAGARPGRSAGGGKVKAAVPLSPALQGSDRQTQLERLVEVRDLAQSGNPAAAERLAWILSQSEDPKVRRNAAQALGKFGNNAAARTVLIDALSDENLLARMAAFKSLTRVGGDGATRAFVQVLSEADDPLSRRAAVFALGELPDQNARKALENARSDRNSAVGEAAERALAQWDQQFGQ